MPELRSAHQEVFGLLSKALASLEKVRVRWRRFADTAQFAAAAEPVEAALRAAQAALSDRGHALPPELMATLPSEITALRRIDRSELTRVIELLQSAYEASRTAQ